VNRGVNGASMPGTGSILVRSGKHPSESRVLIIEVEEIMSTLRIALVSLLGFSAACTLSAQAVNGSPVKVSSPDGQITLLLSDSGAPASGAEPASTDLTYTVEFHGKRLMESAKLGLELVGQPALGPGMHLTASQPETADETYTIPVGKTSSVRNHYNGVLASFEDQSGRKLNIEVRAFNDGIAFRYVVPDQPSLKQVRVANELTEFSYAKDASTYPLILDGYQSSWEDEYQKRNVSGLHPDWLIGLPFLAEEPGLGWVAITEADIDNYAGMYLRKEKQFLSHRVKADLSPLANQAGEVQQGVAVETSTPFQSPWRVLMIGDDPGRLIESNIVLNLNPPSKIADTSWIKAGKSAWDWWSGEAAPSVSFKTGMNTATMKHYIDFASASGFPYMLIDAGCNGGGSQGA